jgi:hypothetical protein
LVSGSWRQLGLLLLVLLKHTIDIFECFLNVLSGLGTCKDDFATSENKQHNFGCMHAIDKARKQLGLICAESAVTRVKLLKGDCELDIAGPNDVLDLEILELHIGDTDLLDHLSIHFGCLFRFLLRFGTGDNHFTRAKDQSCGLRISDTNDHSRETTRVVLCVTTIQGNLDEVKRRDTQVCS